MSARTYRKLNSHYRALVAMAVLLDGNEAATVLGLDSADGEMLRQAADELTRDELEVRLPFIGTLYREALAELGRERDD